MFWINGQLKQQLPLTDRACQFGDGFFTTASLLDGKISFLTLHIERITEAAERLLFDRLDIEALRQEMLIAAATGGSGFIKAIISRGSGNRGYSFSNCGAPVRIIEHGYTPSHYATWRSNGIRLTLNPVRLARNPLLAGIKHLNRLEQVLIQAHLEQEGGDEALVLDTDGNLVECCSANLFWRYGRQVFTPVLSYAGVAGIMRRRVLGLLPKLGYLCEEVTTGPDALKQADEVIITNALLPIAPVNSIGSYCYYERTLFNLLSPQCQC
ncbi:aminodeoxychorismate lyase [Candidatus Palibaumannia cicadellinicola]|uniref:Aminodeoxychorismate lyase n=1 Tax=Candidatus Palibaumannia cicadellinicola TaxID=186490 RepID=A0A088MYJ8_9GAMM|nr:aminodeoxychorismate lyase [Candidatus Baumannia cicadellinicola]AIN47352.1 4-amino-4-deoxychorismate lyase [Candidatus Baumannia cicadellinicola]